MLDDVQLYVAYNTSICDKTNIFMVYKHSSELEYGYHLFKVFVWKGILSALQLKIIFQ